VSNQGKKRGWWGPLTDQKATLLEEKKPIDNQKITGKNQKGVGMRKRTEPGVSKSRGRQVARHGEVAYRGQRKERSGNLRIGQLLMKTGGGNGTKGGKTGCKGARNLSDGGV